ncbi:MAG: hypothetical protein ACI360_08630 [Atopobiaceae bacterium]
MSVKASASVTVSWSAAILAVTRYYQLASSTAATPAVPTSSSSLGSWTETEPTADTTKVLYTCDRTIFADGTESWSKASKSTSYEAAKDAKDAADAAAGAAGAAASDAAKAQTQADAAKSSADSSTSRIDSEVLPGIKQNTKDIFELNKRLSQEIDILSSFLRFSDVSGTPVLDLGNSGSPALLRLTNEQLAFIYKLFVVAYISKDRLYIATAQILTQLVVGGFAAIPRSNGNLCVKYVGDA